VADDGHRAAPRQGVPLGTLAVNVIGCLAAVYVLVSVLGCLLAAGVAYAAVANVLR